MTVKKSEVPSHLLKYFKPTVPHYKAGDLVCVPHLVALALQADGWVLRQDVIWAKPSPMPESVRNRCTKAHEYVFLLTKSMRYFYDAEAVKEKATSKPHAMGNVRAPEPIFGGANNIGDTTRVVDYTNSNKRSVWTVSSQGYEGAHFATFPPKLIEPMIKAGTSEKGCCGRCGAPWRRLLEERKLTRDRPNDYVKRVGESGTGNSCSNSVAGVEARTVGWEPTCECFGRFERRKGVRIGYGDYNLGDDTAETGQSTSLSATAGGSRELREFPTTISAYVPSIPLEDHPVVPCTVLDPFLGSGTTAEVSLSLGRRCWGVELSEKYLKNNAVPRVTGAILSRPALRGLLPRAASKSEGGVSKGEELELS